MDKSTKFCELKVFLKNGQHVTGLFHVPSSTSSAIRPSDALQEKKHNLLLLTDVTFYENDTSRKIPAIVMPHDSIAYIELPAGWSTREEEVDSLPAGWSMREEADPPSAVTPTPIPQPLPVRPPVMPSPTPRITPKWMAQRTQKK